MKARLLRPPYLAVIGALALGLSLIGVFTDATRFFESYLFSYLFWSELTLGSLALLMVYHLTGGAWGEAARGVLEASTRTGGVAAMLFVPIFFGLGRLFPWADRLTAASDPQLVHNHLYLNPGFFAGRAVFYWVAWLLLAHFTLKWGRSKQDEARLRSLCGGGLVFLGFSVSFAAIDWQMSLEPRWHSTVYGMVFGSGQALGAWAFTILVLISRGGLPARKQTRWDLGNILLTLVMVWAYLSFVQFLIIWSGNLPEEVSWFNHRNQNGWEAFVIGLIVFQFAMPFSALLLRGVKNRDALMAALCSLVLAIRLVDRYWLVLPAHHRDRIPWSWLDLALLVGIGGLWLATFSASEPVAPREGDKRVARAA